MPFTSGRAHVTGNNTGLLNDSAPWCFSGAGPDGVISFIVPAGGTKDLLATITGANTLSLRSTCSLAASELACERSTLQGGTSRLQANALLPGTYFLWIESEETPGPFALDLTLTATPLLGESCASGAVPLTFNSSGVATVSSTLVGRQDDNDYRLSCAGGGPDVVYTFELARAQRVTTELRSGLGMYGRVNVLGPSPTCIDTYVSTPVNLCEHAFSRGATLTTDELRPGRYWVYVDTQTGDADAFTLTLQTAEIEGESCAAPQALEFSADRTTAGTANGHYRSDDVTTSCGPSGSADTVFSFSLPVASWVQGWASTSAGNTAAIALKNAAQCGGSELSCSAAVESVPLAKRLLPAGDYVAVVETTDTTSNATDQYVNLKAIPSVGGSGTGGNSCSSAGNIAFVGGAATVSATTVGMTSAASGSCGGTSAPDQVFRITSTSTGRLRVLLTPDTNQGGIYPIMYLRQGSSCSTATQVTGGCVYGTYSATLDVANLPAGTYWLWVDSDSPGAGFGYTLEATLN